MHTYTNSKFIDFQSGDRYTGTNTSLTYRIPTPIREAHRITLLSAEIPFQVYNIRSPFNTVSWTYSGTTYTATVTSGSYTMTTLLSALQTAMNAASAVVFTLTYSTTTLRVTAAASASVTWVSTSLGTRLGFTAGQSGTSITATNAYDISIDKYITISIKNLPSSYLGNSSRRQVTFKIPCDIDSGYIQYHAQNSTMTQWTDINESQLGELWIDLLDQYGNTVDLNGCEWSALLRVDYTE